MLSLTAGADGWCNATRKEIAVNEDLAPNGQMRVLVHELAHALGIGYKEHGRARAEVIVDAATYIVCASVGLDVSCESVSYLADWGGEQAVETVRETAELIDGIARRLEDALAAGAEADAAVAA